MPSPDDSGHSRPPALPTSSLDSSRIIRPDYAKSAYAKLAHKAQELWRGGWPLTLWNEDDGPENRNGDEADGVKEGGKEELAKRREKLYRESGLLLTGTDELGNRAGEEYVRESYENVVGLEGKSGKEGRKCSWLSDKEAVQEVLGTGGCTGDWGYINPNSGWADAEGAMAVLRERVWELGRRREEEEWFEGRAEKLVCEEEDRAQGWRIAGARLENGSEIRADVTVLAAGAWSATLLPKSLGRRIKARGQVLAYVDISNEERRSLGGKPVALDLSSGMFAIFPPTVEEEGFEEGRSEKRHHVKLARHGWGYAHTVPTPDSEPSSSGARSKPINLDLPAPQFSPIPAEGQTVCSDFTAHVAPELAGRPFASTRLCWYADTGTGDFIIDWVPRYGRSVLVATGGSGHGFKFTPIIGDLIMQRLEGTIEEELGELWRWRGDEEIEKEWEDGEGDGSRGGRKGMLWETEMAKGL